MMITLQRVHRLGLLGNRLSESSPRPTDARFAVLFSFFLYIALSFAFLFSSWDEAGLLALGKIRLQIDIHTSCQFTAIRYTLYLTLPYVRDATYEELWARALCEYFHWVGRPRPYSNR